MEKSFTTKWKKLIKKVRSFMGSKAVDFVNTPEDWATANHALIVEPDGTTYMVTVQIVTYPSARLINDYDRQRTISVRNSLVKRFNFLPWNWWCNHRLCTDVKASTYFKR